jgi:hypothetical protein
MPRFLLAISSKGVPIPTVSRSQQQDFGTFLLQGLLVSSSGQTSFELNPADLRYGVADPR